MEITATAIVDVNLPRIGFDFGINAKRRGGSPHADGLMTATMQIFSNRLNNPAVALRAE